MMTWILLILLAKHDSHLLVEGTLCHALMQCDINVVLQPVNKDFIFCNIQPLSGLLYVLLNYFLRIIIYHSIYNMNILIIIN